MTYGGKTLIGLVGYTPVLDTYPLGPRLMAALERVFDGEPQVVIENMTWGPMHIVQRFQDPDVIQPDRLVLVGAASVSHHAGAVSACRWVGGDLPEATIQERIYEAVTGIVDIENTLIIGEHFKTWPGECFSVEVDLPTNTFGRMVIADNEGWNSDGELQAHLGFSPADTLARIAETTIDVARHGNATVMPLQEKAASDLAPLDRFAVNHVVGLPMSGDPKTGGA